MFLRRWEEDQLESQKKGMLFSKLFSPIAYLLIVIKTFIDLLNGMIVFLILLLLGTVWLGSKLYVGPYTVKNINTVHRLLIENDVEFPGVVLTQILIETDWFKSPLCLEKNNITGMHCNPGRDNGPYCECSKDNKREADGVFCHYQSWDESIKHLKRWQTKRLRDYRSLHGNGVLKTRHDYYNFLDCMHIPEWDPVGDECFRYAGLKTYTKLLEVRKEQLKKYEKSKVERQRNYLFSLYKDIYNLKITVGNLLSVPQSTK